MRRLSASLSGALLAALLAAGIFAALFAAGATARLDWLAYDQLFRLRGARAGSPDVVTVDIDDQTVRDLGAFPFSREHYPKLIRALDADGCRARAVAFDIFFLEPDAAHDEEIGRAAREHGAVCFPALFGTPLAPRAELDRAIAERRELVGAAAHQLELKQNEALFARFLADPLATRGELAGAVRRAAAPQDPVSLREARAEDLDPLAVRLIEEEHRERVRSLVRQRMGRDGLARFVKGELDAAFEQDFAPERLRWAKQLMLGDNRVEVLWGDYLEAREKDPAADLLAACAAAGQDYGRLTAPDSRIARFADQGLRRRLAADRSAPAAPLGDSAISTQSADFPVLPVEDAAGRLVSVQPCLDYADGTVRALPLVIVHGERAYPSMGLAVALDVLGARLEDCRFEPGAFVIPAATGRAERRIPVDDRGRALLAWNGPWLGAFRHVPMGSLIAGKADVSAFDGKLVFVGLTASGSHDLNPMPFESRYPMVGANAELAEGILSDGFIRRAPRSWTLGLIALAALVGALAGAALHKGWSAAAAAAGLGGLSGGAYAAFAAGMIFVPPAGALGGFSLAYVAGLFWRYQIGRASWRGRV